MTELTALGTFPNKPVHCIMQEEGITQHTGYPLGTHCLPLFFMIVVIWSHGITGFYAG